MKKIIILAKKYYGDITAIGAILFLLVQAVSLIKIVGTFNVIDYYNYWKTVDVEIKLYLFTFLNLLLTIILFSHNKTQPKKKPTKSRRRK